VVAAIRQHGPPPGYWRWVRKTRFSQKACIWLANALIRRPAMLSTAVNPTDGLRFDGDAASVAEGDVHP
jgi:hypothetical protein